MALTARVVVEPMRLDDVAAVHEIERLSFPCRGRPTRSSRSCAATGWRTTWWPGPETRVVGFAGVWLMVDESHITTFGVHPDWRRQGIGRQLLLAVDRSVEPTIGARRMTLEVRESNEAAQALYRSFGFESSVDGRATTPTTARMPW